MSKQMWVAVTTRTFDKQNNGFYKVLIDRDDLFKINKLALYVVVSSGEMRVIGKTLIGGVCDNSSSLYIAYTILGINDHNRKLIIKYNNNNPRDLRKSNLSVISHNEKCILRTNRNKNDGLPRGVRKRGDRFYAQITIARRVIYLGNYDTPDEASDVYQRARSEYLKDLQSVDLNN